MQRFSTWCGRIAIILGLTILGTTAIAQFAIAPGGRSPFFGNRSNYNGVLRAFPQKYVYLNTTLGTYPNAYPYKQIEFFVSPTGVPIAPTGQLPNRQPSGLTPADSFATPQQCYDHVAQTYYYDGTLPICRILPGTYTGAIQVTGPIAGAQIDGGSAIFFWGTCALSGSPWNNSVGGGGTASDVVLRSLAGGSVFSVINQGNAKANCVTISADAFPIAIQAHSNFFIDGSVRIVTGPNNAPSSILYASNMGQMFVAAMAVETGATTAFAFSQNLSQITFLGGASTVSFTGGPVFGQTFFVESNSLITLPGATTLTNTLGGGTGAKCAINYSSTVRTSNGTAASIPGTATCAAGATSNAI